MSGTGALPGQPAITISLDQAEALPAGWSGVEQRTPLKHGIN